MTCLEEVGRSVACHDAAITVPGRTGWLDSPMAMGLDYVTEPGEFPLDSPSDRACLLPKTANVGLPADGMNELRHQHELLVVGWSCLSIGLVLQLGSTGLVAWGLFFAQQWLGMAGVMALVAGQLLLVIGFLINFHHVRGSRHATGCCHLVREFSCDVKRDAA